MPKQETDKSLRPQSKRGVRSADPRCATCWSGALAWRWQPSRCSISCFSGPDQFNLAPC
jgi:hypothetical protein